MFLTREREREREGEIERERERERSKFEMRHNFMHGKQPLFCYFELPLYTTAVLIEKLAIDMDSF